MGKLIFIASAPHSGSTLLELRLCRSPGTVGVGEAFQLIDPRNRRLARDDLGVCTCGEPVRGCRFWAPVLAELETRPDPRVFYERLARRAIEIVGADATVVDSSKTLRALQCLHAAAPADMELQVLLLIRDVRAWYVSMRAAQHRRPLATDQSFLAAIRARGRRLVRQNRFYAFHDWYRFHRQVTAYTRKHGIPCLSLTYRQLCLDEAGAVRRLVDVLGFAGNEQGAAAMCHNVFGNRMRLDPGRRERVDYDARWLADDSWRLPARLLPHVGRYNRAVHAGAPAPPGGEVAS